MAIAITQLTTEQRYQRATENYTRTDIPCGLKRQWEFITEPKQKILLAASSVLTISVATACIQQGLKIGENISEKFSLKSHKKTALVIASGAVTGVIGLTTTIVGEAYVLEHSENLTKWKQVKINNAVEQLILEEFESDNVLSQFDCPISASFMRTPMRTPAGQCFDRDSLMKIADSQGRIKDIYNKTIHLPTDPDPTTRHPISYCINACIKDKEAMIVIGKRLRYLAYQKSQEVGLSEETRNIFSSYRESLGKMIKLLYLKEKRKIDTEYSAQMDEASSEIEIEQADLQHTRKTKIFKNLFGASVLGDINWSIERDWSTILNQRWMKQYHS